ncbi:MAG: RNA-binding protein [Candidatus Delongbacteria bacterium]
MKIYAGNLSYKTTDEDLRKTFEQFGKVDSAEVVKDKIDGRSKGFGFVEMPSDEEAVIAIRELDGTELHGRNVKINESRPKPQGKPGFRNRGGFGDGHGDRPTNRERFSGNTNRGGRGGDR